MNESPQPHASSEVNAHAAAPPTPHDQAIQPLGGQYWHAEPGDTRLGYIGLLTATHVHIADGIPMKQFKAFMAAMDEGKPPLVAFAEIPKGTMNIPWQRVRSIEYTPRFKELKVFYDKEDAGPDAKPKKALLSAEEQETLDALFADFEAARPEQPQEEELSAWQATQGPIFATVAVAAIGVFFAIFAATVDPNEEVTGRRRGMKKLMLWLSDTLGPGGVAAITALVLAGTITWWVKRLKNRPVRRVLMISAH